MTNVASIDIGTNSIRLAIVEVRSADEFKLLHKARESVRIGQEVFTSGRIGSETIVRAARVCKDFKRLIDKHDVAYTKAVSTSALREAENGDVFLDRMAESSGIDVEVITWKEEVRLIHMGISEKIDFQGFRALLIDVGGGSVEVAIATQDEVVSSWSYELGPVRLLQLLGAGKTDERTFFASVQEHVQTFHASIQSRIEEKDVDVCIATGGSIESLDELHGRLYSKHCPKRLPVDDLGAILNDLSRLSILGRMESFNLQADRADVIVPAAIVLKEFALVSGVDEIHVPYCGLQDGILLDLVLRNLKQD